MRNVTLVLLAVIQLVIVAILAYRSRTTVNKYFMALVGGIAIWTVVNASLDYLQYSLNASLVSLEIVNRAGFFLGTLVLFLSYRLSNNFPIVRKPSKFSQVLNVMYILLLLVMFTPPVSGHFYIDPSTSSTQYAYGAYIWLIAVFAVPLIFLTSKNFIVGYKRAESTVKKQTAIIFGGLLSCIVLGVTFVVVLPAVTGSENLIFFGYFAPLIFTGAIIYAMAKHQLFDIRLFVFRALVYALTITVVGLLYTVLVYGVGSIFIDISNISYAQRTFFAVLALLIAATYAPIVRFFNKYTSKIFYRDAYDTQEVLDQIGKIIVGSIDLHKIQKSSLEVLLSALKPSYGGFILKDSEGEVRVQDFVGEAPNFELGELSKIVHKVGKRTVVYDELEQTNNENTQLLRKNDISLIVPLITKNETIGYFITGPKKSGNIFNQQDKSMMTIAANELAVALQNAQRFEEIQAFNITLQEKVDEATKELKKTNRKLVELDEAKDEFISMASHQLRTPLTSIKGYLSMLIEGDLGKVSKEQDQALKEAFTSSQRMVFLISDFLNVSRIKTGKFVIEPKEVNLSEMVQQEMVQLKEMAESKNLNMVYDPPADFPTVKLDENKMHQVMMNMMDNAIYYTPNEGTITTQLYLDGKDVVFKVIDTGIGVPKAEQHKLFSKFFRAGNARKTRPDGTGLGLFMAQKVIVAQGGSVIFESLEGKGSTFGFRFPLAAVKA